MSARLAAVGAAAAVLTSGCAVFSPRQTDIPYNPADGVPVDMGALKARDLLLLSEGKDQPAVLSGALINSSSQAMSVRLRSRVQADQDGSGPATSGVVVELKPGETRILDIQLAQTSAVPGALSDINITTDKGSQLVSVPVLKPGTFKQYATLTPTGPGVTSKPAESTNPSPTTTAAH